MKIAVPADTDLEQLPLDLHGLRIVPGTILCIGLCKRTSAHRHDLTEAYGLPARMHEYPTLSEIVTRLAQHYGLEVLSIPDSRRVQMRGWPDLTIKGKRTIIWRELKNPFGTLTPEQRKVGSLLPDWAVWRPADLWSGHIENKLKELA